MNYLTEQEKTSVTAFPNVGQEVEKTRALQEVQAAIFMARQFPRDEFGAQKKIMESAKRLSLAEKAIYCYPRGGQQVKGASIRTAETIAKYWGNLSFGIKELSQNAGDHSSEMMAYAWDLESNVRQERVFKVPHIRYSKNGGNSILTDPRDIYEKTANDGARRLRACILGILPTDVVEDFIKVCEKTIEGSSEKPLKERLNDMLNMFEELGITKDMIEKRIGTKVENFIPKNLVDLGSVYNSIKNNFAPVEQYFEIQTRAEKQKEEIDKKLKTSGKDGKKQQYEPTPEELDQLAKIYNEDKQNEQPDIN